MSIEIKKLTYSFDKSPLVKDLSFLIKKNQIGLISGNNGVGKTTLFNVISGLKRPKSGEITLNETILDKKNFSMEAEKRNIGYVFQDFALFPHINSEKNMQYAMCPENTSLYKELISKLGLIEILQKMPHELSGGQQQRVALIRAILMKPKLLLLDEPFSNLDRKNIIIVQNVIKEVVKSFNIPCLMISHDLKSNDSFTIDIEIAIK